MFKINLIKPLKRNRWITPLALNKLNQKKASKELYFKLFGINDLKDLYYKCKRQSFWLTNQKDI